MSITLYQNIAEILQAARAKSYRAVNYAMIEAYWSVGQQIVEEEQQGKHRAEYGAKLLPYLAKNYKRILEKDLTKVIYAICGCFIRLFQFVTHCVTN
jgi:DUF1016 N-terminal domain